ncbi:twin-arginine translocation signal domain-containing protein [Benzoatithermus flavus]|uniref:Twin-arginine translocation signal domain-containing protein n=1 Tax=Benzoatithermus flavus TaxID=3108223 RepID=A0ABU8XU61_9PROT
MRQEQKRQASGIERRDFLRGAGIAAAGAAAALPGTAGAAEVKENPQEQVKSRYQENDHVRRYYELNRL